MLKYYMTLCFLILSACSKNSSSSENSGDAAIAPQGQTSKLDGQRYWIAGTYSGSSDKMILVAGIKGSKFVALTIRLVSGGGTAYYRKSEGTYTYSGDRYVITYTYETCGPLETRTYNFVSSDPSDSVIVTEDGSTETLIFRNDKKYIPAIDLSNLSVLVEDKGCNTVANARNTNRLPASSEKGWALKGFIPEK